jgi:Cu(I)/Ag(I) efflux system periplasmic protein CusF
MKHLTVAVILITAFATPAYAQPQADDHSAHHAGPAASDATLTEGEVRRVDKDAKKLTIRHGPILNLDMPAMTMVFLVKDPAMLDKLSNGDKIKFFAEKIGGTITVTRIEPAK